MASNLAIQLNQIRAKSINPLDLKAQKKAHSKSLLFHPRDAATQDFDTLFEICFEGFQELCQLDSRFTSFSANLFSAQSRQEDRVLMTPKQNSHLDRVIDDFLGLVGGRLQLEPALKAVEWLVRRFRYERHFSIPELCLNFGYRAHENNTVFLIFTFLPYHASPLFSTMLKILPDPLPTRFKFLAPYLQSPTAVPRQVFIHAAAHNIDFFKAFNTYIVRLCQKNEQNATALAFWSTTATEALARKVDQSRNMRQGAQKQIHEDLLLMILPILNEGLSLNHVPDLKMACYMMVTVLASKVYLDEHVLVSMMNAITSGWDTAPHAGLICLSVLAQQRKKTTLPASTFKALQALKTISDDLVILGRKYDVSRLALGLVLGVINRSCKSQDSKHINLIRAVIESNILSAKYVSVAIMAIIRMIHKPREHLHTSRTLDSQNPLTNLLLWLADSQTVGHVVRSTLNKKKIDLESFNSIQPADTADELNHLLEDAETAKAEDGQPPSQGFEYLLEQIPTQIASEISFLSHSNSSSFASLSDAFVSACQSPRFFEKFLNLAVLRRRLALQEPFFISFFIRIWCGPFAANVRVTAITAVIDCLKDQDLNTDVQMILPYMLHALADPSKSVRHAAVDLALALDHIYNDVMPQQKHELKPHALGQDQFQGQHERTERISWLSQDEIAKLLSNVIVPSLEECRLDASQVSHRLLSCIKKTAHKQESDLRHAELKRPLRSSLFNSFCSHVIHTPLYSVKTRLLPMVTQIKQVGNSSCSKLMMPLLVKICKQTRQELEDACNSEQTDASQFANNLMAIISPADHESIETVKDLIMLTDSPSPSMTEAFFRRLRKIWPLMKHQSQLIVTKTILDMSFDDSISSHEYTQTEALHTLQNVHLSSEILLALLDGLPTLSSSHQQKPPSPKRRRIGLESTPDASMSQDTVSPAQTRKISFVLEVVGSSDTGKDPSLLGSLLRILGDLLAYGRQSGRHSDFLTLMAVENLLVISKTAEVRSWST
ncbi:MAG: hypothetical protein Q9190_003028 [Brigantiaea leucoxantha]